jgi:hypothetical protein
MDIDQLAAFRDCLLPLPQVRTLKLNLRLPQQKTMPTTLLSQILCALMLCALILEYIEDS